MRNETIVVENILMEKRLHRRHRAHTHVFIKQSNGKRVGCHAENLSASGVGIRTDKLGLRVDSSVELIFVIHIGDVSKIHRRNAVVRHVHNGVTGFHMSAYDGK